MFHAILPTISFVHWQPVEVWHKLRSIMVSCARMADILDAIAHLEHAVSIVGIEHVGLGTDFDGDGGIRGLADSSELILFTQQLLRRKYSETDIAKIWGGNWLRVMRQVQESVK